MIDRPGVDELRAGVEFTEQRLVGLGEGDAGQVGESKYLARICSNLTEILVREARLGAKQRAEARSLLDRLVGPRAGLGEQVRILDQRIGSGELAATSQLRQDLLTDVENRLKIARPDYLRV